MLSENYGVYCEVDRWLVLSSSGNIVRAHISSISTVLNEDYPSKLMEDNMPTYTANNMMLIVIDILRN